MFNTIRKIKLFKKKIVLRQLNFSWFLGYQGGIRTTSGVAIGWFSGVQGIEDEEVVPYNFTSDTLWACETLCGIAGILPLDILLTSPWPANVRGNEGISDV